MTLTALTSFVQDIKVPPHVRRWIGVAAVLAFAFGCFIAIGALPEDMPASDLGVLVWVAVLGVPLTVLLNTLEMRTTANATGNSMPFASAFKVTVLGSAANMLPLPGGTMVRIAALTRAGAGLGKSAGITVLVGLLWLGIAGLVSAWGLAYFSVGAGIATGVLALLATAIVLVTMFQQTKHTGAVFKLAAIKFALITTDLWRLSLCFAGFGIAVTPQQVSIFAIAGALGAAVSIVPAGFGVREGMSALLAPIAKLGAASGFLAPAVNRLIGMPVLLAAALLVVALERGSKAPS